MIHMSRGRYDVEARPLDPAIYLDSEEAEHWRGLIMAEAARLDAAS